MKMLWLLLDFWFGTGSNAGTVGNDAGTSAHTLDLPWTPPRP